MRVSARQLEIVEQGHNKYYRGYVLDATAEWGVMFQWGRRGTLGQSSPLKRCGSRHEACWAQDDQLSAKEYKKGYESVGEVSFEIDLTMSADHKTLHEVLDRAFLAAWAEESDQSLEALRDARPAEPTASTVVALRGLAETGRSQPWAVAAREAVEGLVLVDTPASREVVGIARERAGLAGRGRYQAIAEHEDLILVLADETTLRWLQRNAAEATIPLTEVGPGDDAAMLAVALGLTPTGASPGELAQAVVDARLCMG